MKLGTVAKVQGGYAFKSQEFQNEGVPIIRIGNLDGKNVEVDNEVCYPMTFWDKHPEFRVEKNNILVAMSGATVGKIGLYESDEKALLNQRVCILKPDGKTVTNDYLYFFCLSPVFKNAIKESAFGCAQPNISAMQICDFEINVPDIKEQEKWVYQLRKIKNIIDKREQDLVELDNLIKSRFVEMFGDPIRNTQNRPTTDFVNVVKMQRGFDLPVQDRQQNGNIAVFGSNGALDRHNIAKVQGGGVITGRSGTIGKVYYTEEDYWPLNTSLFSVDMHGNNIIYLAYLLQMYDLSRFTEGTGVPTLNRNKFHNKPIINVSLSEQEEFAAFVHQVDKFKFKVEKSLNETQQLFDSLMQKYFG